MRKESVTNKNGCSGCSQKQNAGVKCVAALVGKLVRMRSVSIWTMEELDYYELGPGRRRVFDHGIHTTRENTRRSTRYRFLVAARHRGEVRWGFSRNLGRCNDIRKTITDWNLESSCVGSILVGGGFYKTGGIRGKPACTWTTRT